MLETIAGWMFGARSSTDVLIETNAESSEHNMHLLGNSNTSSEPEDTSELEELVDEPFGKIHEFVVLVTESSIEYWISVQSMIYLVPLKLASVYSKIPATINLP